MERLSRVRVFLGDAREFMGRGVGEFEEGLRESDQVRVRDAVEKLWNAVICATNALTLRELGVVPASRWERRFLEKLEDEDPRIGELGLRDRYSARERRLHMMTFYEGIIDFDMLGREVKSVGRYIADVERLIV